MTIFIIRRIIGSAILAILYSGVAFSQEIRTLSIHDIVGTFYLDRIENSWFSDSARESLYREFTANYSTFVIGENYYILRGFRRETLFTMREIEEDGIVPMIPERTSHQTSEARQLFLDIPRLFDVVFETGGRIWVIEVLNVDTVVIRVRGSFLLYRRVTEGQSVN